ncbi:cytochrome-c peroxidase [Thiohalocapsa halophila]|uniref:cytochrome-c peroxidase n=1 Tax=Thiohalocapsa halophila TaxID=69359 RepID=UPI002ADD79EA|nr:cytochrome c peroxidase [Thiohalocapsa halophila]
MPAPLTDTDFHADGAPPPAEVALGRLLFFDKLLSGNRNIACATCHHPDAATGDGLALSIGEGGRGPALERTPGLGADRVPARVGRNATPLFNVGARSYKRMFHDGRVEVHPQDPARFLTPAGSALPGGLRNVLAAQAMFPVLAPLEMAGQEGENAIAEAVAAGDFQRAWALLTARLQNPANGYTDYFIDVFPHIDAADDIGFVDAANALAAFQAATWRSDNAPFDSWLRGDRTALSEAEQRGLNLFYGDAGCHRCHSGPLLTDHRFHAVGMPQLGQGKGNGFDGLDDFGRENVTGDPADRYRFRTPSLRNVMLTGPWGHAGGFDSLRNLLRHHLDPVAGLRHYSPAPLAPARADLAGTDLTVMRSHARRDAIARRVEQRPVRLTDGEVADLLAFLGALTDATLSDAQSLVPGQVPSGLPVRD